MKLLLFLSAGHLYAQLMAGGRIVMQREFAGTTDGQSDFAVFMGEMKHPVYLLADLVEEDFRQETVPHLGGSSRSALLQRKLDQFYHGTPFRQANLLQRQKTGRRDDDMLFSALTNPALIEPWLDIMWAQQTPLAGIYSVPQVSAPLVKDHPSNHLLLVSWGKFSGLRQTYFSNHRLLISRLSPVSEGLTFQDVVAGEIARTYLYLKSLSLLPAGQTLDVCLLGHSHDLLELQLALPRSADMRYDFADLAEIARQRHIGYRFTDSDASQIFLHQLAAHPPQTHYANTTHTRCFTLKKYRRALDLTSAVLLLVALLWGIANLWQRNGDATETVSLNARAQLTLDEARKITPTIPDTGASAAEMKSGVDVMHKLDQYSFAPDSIFYPVSAVLDRYPQIELGELAWQMDTAEPAAPGIPALTVTLKGNLTDFAGDYRAALDYLERFQSGLSARGYRVTALAKPLDVSPGGSIASVRERPDTLGFSLKISRNPPI